MSATEKSEACGAMFEEDTDQIYENVLAEIQSFELPIEVTLSCRCKIIATLSELFHAKAFILYEHHKHSVKKGSPFIWLVPCHPSGDVLVPRDLTAIWTHANGKLFWALFQKLTMKLYQFKSKQDIIFL